MEDQRKQDEGTREIKQDLREDDLEQISGGGTTPSTSNKLIDKWKGTL